jgi:hypothetical protein
MEALNLRLEEIEQAIECLETQPMDFCQTDFPEPNPNSGYKTIINRITALENKPEPKPAAPSTFASAVAKGLPQKPTPQDSADLSNNSKATAAKVLRSPYPKASRQVLVCFANRSAIDTSQDTEDQALEAVNTALAATQLQRRLFHGAKFSLAKNLVLTTGLHETNENLAGYLVTIEDSLRFILNGSAKLQEPWTKFLLHGVPTKLDLDTIRRDVENYCPTVKLGQTPRWLAPEQNRKDKPASTVVLAFLGSVNFSTLGGRTIRVGNRPCNLTKYIQFSTSTQCTKCQGFGHPKEFCTAGPRCAVCAGAHLTSDHQCPEKICKGGYLCLHQDLKCVNCQGPHRAANRSCPEKVKRSQEFREMIRQRMESRML